VGKERIQVFLDESDVKYIQMVRNLLGIESNSEAVRFLIKLLRLILPRAPYVAQVVSRLMEEGNECTRC